MTTRQLIQALIKANPVGDLEVYFSQGDVEGYAWTPTDGSSFKVLPRPATAGDGPEAPTTALYIEEYR